MGTISLLYNTSYSITDKIKVVIPTVGQILDHEDEYYTILSSLTAMPIDMMVQLDDAGIDFTEIDEYDLFLMLFFSVRSMDTSLVFGDLDLSKFEIAQRENDKKFVLLDKENDIVINRMVQNKIAETLRKIHHLEKNIRKPGNGEAKKYMIQRAREKQKRDKHRSSFSQLEALIISLVNTEQFKYNYESARDLTIYQFNESVRQIVNKINYDNRMHGVYAGTVNPKELSRDEMMWILQNK